MLKRPQTLYPERTPPCQLFDYHVRIRIYDVISFLSLTLHPLADFCNNLPFQDTRLSFPHLPLKFITGSYHYAYRPPYGFLQVRPVTLILKYIDARLNPYAHILRQPYLSLESDTPVQYDRGGGFGTREIASDTSRKDQVEHPALPVGKQRREVTKVIGAEVYIEVLVRSAVVAVQKRRAASG
jgi:hypothetical protein